MSKDGDYVGDEIYLPHNALVPRDSPGLTRKGVLQCLYRRVLSEMSMNRFTWDGMPRTIDTRYLEWTLLNTGLAVFYFDDEYDRFMALRGTGSGVINMYDNPTEFRVYGNAMLNKTIRANDCVPIWSNYHRTPEWDVITIYSQKLAEADRTIEVNMLAERTPFMFAVDNNERLTVQNAFRQVQEGAPVIWATDSLNFQAIQEKAHLFDLRTDKDTLLNNMTAKVRIWNEALTLLGIMNVNSEKRERMVVEEASGASGQVMAMRAVALNARQVACDMINEKYGLEVSVEWNLDSSISKGSPGLDDIDMGGVSDGDVYN